MSEDIKKETTDEVVKAISFEEARKSPEFEKELGSFMDSRINTAIDAHKVKGFAKAVDEGVAAKQKALETKTPDQIKFEEYELKLSEMEKKVAEKEKAEMRGTNKEVGRAAFKEAKLPDTLLDFFVSENSETSKTNIDRAAKALDDFRTQITQDILAGNNIKVPGRTTGDSDGIKQPREDAPKQEWTNYWKKVKESK